MIRNEIAELEELARKIRRELHQIPEEGYKEFKTSKYIQSYLHKLGINTIKVAETGLVAIIEGKNKTESIAFRADMDGLALYEKNNVDFISRHDGYMHACGHDGHMTILLVFAMYIVENNIVPENNIVLVFQPAEEGPGGAKEIIKAGIMEKYNVKKIYGCHIMPSIEEGIIGINQGPQMAQTGEVYITVKGKGSHAAVPHKSVDAIMITANLINTIQTIVSRNIDPFETTLLSIGTISGGTRLNVVADEVKIAGTMRAFTEETYLYMKQRLSDIIKGFEKTFSCTIDFRVLDMYPPVVNDTALTKEFIDLTKGMNIIKAKPMMIAEDFSYYQKVVPGVFFYIGSKNEDKQMIWDLHDCKFNFDERILLNVVELYGRIAEGI